MAQLTLNQTTLLGATTGTIQSLLLPVGGRQLLLPASAVAEIVDSTGIVAEAGLAPWFLGRMPWRELQIPVYSFEGLNGQDVPGSHSRIAVMSAVSQQGELPFYGLLLQGVPRPARVKIAELEDLESAPVGPVEFLQVRYAGELACIPDLDALEAKVLAA